ncbi:energy transducer TonB [Pontibacter sp. XAAS-A31]|nr:energy transducer TonB [Pontibacter harenae]
MEIIYSQEERPLNAQKLGELKITDSGFSLNCGFLEVLELAKAKAVESGGDAVYITSFKAPDSWSTCYRIEAELYKLQEPYVSKLSAASPNVHAVTEGDTVAFIETMPAFPLGEQELLKFLSREFRYPASAVKDKVEGQVIVAYVVDRTGKIGDIEIRQSVREDVDQEEAIEAISDA